MEIVMYVLGVIVLILAAYAAVLTIENKSLKLKIEQIRRRYNSTRTELASMAVTIGKMKEQIRDLRKSKNLPEA